MFSLAWQAVAWLEDQGLRRHIDFETEKTFEGLRGVNGGYLRFDLAIRHDGGWVLVELDGAGIILTLS